MSSEKLSSAKLNETRLKLFEILGDKKLEYLAFLRRWLTAKISRETFDLKARSLIRPEHSHLHNAFFLGILNDAFFNSSSRTQPQLHSNVPHGISEKSVSHPNSSKYKRKTPDKTNFEPYEAIETHPFSPIPPNVINDMPSPRYASQELFLPDTEMINGRMHICAWSEDLEGADANIAEYVVQAVQVYLKNIITAIITKHKGYKVRRGFFQHSFGCDVPNPWLRNTNYIVDHTDDAAMVVSEDEPHLIPKRKPTLPDIEMRTAFEYSCSNANKNISRVTMHQVYNTLKNNPKVIGNHSVYSINMEKIIMCLRQITDCN